MLLDAGALLAAAAVDLAKVDDVVADGAGDGARAGRARSDIAT